MSAKGEKVGEISRELSVMQAANQNNVTDTSCYEEEKIEEKTILLDHIPKESDADRCV